MSDFDENDAFEAAAKPSLSAMAMAARGTSYLDDLNPEQRDAVETRRRYLHDSLGQSVRVVARHERGHPQVVHLLPHLPV